MNNLLYYFDILGLICSILAMHAITLAVYLQNRYSLVNQTFCKMVFGIATYTTAVLFFVLSPNITWLNISFRLVYVAALPGLFYALCCAYVFPKGNPVPLWAKLAMLTSSLFFAFAWGFTDWMFQGFRITDPRYLFLCQPIYGPYRLLFTLHEMSFLTLAITMIAKNWKNSSLGDRPRFIYLAIGFIGTGTTILIFIVILPMLGHMLSFSYSLSLITIFTIITSFSVGKHGIFKINPKIAATEILDLLGPSIMACDIEGRIIYKSPQQPLLEQKDIDEAVDIIIAQGILKDHHLLSGSFSISGGLFKKGVIIIAFYDITTIEDSYFKEKQLSSQIAGKLKHEKELRDTLGQLVEAGSSGQVEEIANNAFPHFLHNKEAFNTIQAVQGAVVDTFRLAETFDKHNTMLAGMISQENKIMKEIAQLEQRISEAQKEMDRRKKE